MIKQGFSQLTLLSKPQTTGNTEELLPDHTLAYVSYTRKWPFYLAVTIIKIQIYKLTTILPFAKNSYRERFENMLFEEAGLVSRMTSLFTLNGVVTCIQSLIFCNRYFQSCQQQRFYLFPDL